MTTSTSRPGRQGRYVTTTVAGETVRAYVPPRLPPNPPIDVSRLVEELGRAERAIGRLDGITDLLPSPELFIYMFVRKEAVLSSQIEGTQSSLSDLLQYETNALAGQPVADVGEVSNYVNAMMHGLVQLDKIPLSLRLIRDIHFRLMDGVRGNHATPGEFRRSQNWIGGRRPGNAIFVPPPSDKLAGCLDAFEKFIHEKESRLPILIKAGLLHAQFETIHPFLDGNGRVGRLLITLFLYAEGVLKQPLLYVSLFMKIHRAEYYRLLQAVRVDGAWEAWLSYFLEGVAETANQAFDAAMRIVALFKADREAIVENSRRPKSALHVHDIMQRQPFSTIPSIVAASGLSAPTVAAALLHLTRIGIVREVSGRKRSRVFAYQKYVDIVGEDTAPL